ncbi:tyrosine-type recombinase/integrase [Rhizobium ruizarguesonis]
MARISIETIKELHQTEAGTVIRDEILGGFQARRIKTGVTYAFEYRAGGGRKAPVKRYTIGRHGKLTPDQARKIARDLSLEVAVGKDPQQERNRSRAMPTLLAYAKALWDDQEEIAANHPESARVRKSTLKGYRSLMRNHVGPALGNRGLDKISRTDVKGFHTALSKSNPVVANRCLQVISSLYGYAAVDGHVQEGTNPTFGIRRNQEVERERYLSPAELMRLGDTIKLAETAGLPWVRPIAKPGKKAKHIPKSGRPYVISERAAAALRLLILTGRRLNEILHAKRSEIDFGRRIMTRATKTGRQHVVLNTAAMEILESLPHEGEYLFPSKFDARKPMSDLNKPWRAIRRYASLEGMRLHDLRHSFASIVAAGGASLPMIGKLLGHTQPRSTARYAHLADDPLRVTTERAGGQILEGLYGAPGDGRN